MSVTVVSELKYLIKQKLYEEVELCQHRPADNQRSFCDAKTSSSCSKCGKAYGSVFRWKLQQHEPNPVGLATYLGREIALKVRERERAQAEGWDGLAVRYTSGGAENNEFLWDVSVLRKQNCGGLPLLTAPLLACEVQAVRGAKAFGKMLSKIVVAEAELRVFLYVRSNCKDPTPEDVITIVRRSESEACKKSRLLIGRASYLDGPNRRGNLCKPSCAQSVRWDWASDPPER